MKATPRSLPPEAAVQHLVEILPATASGAPTLFGATPGPPIHRVSAPLVNRTTWVANANYHVNTKQDYSKVVLAAFLTRAYEDNPKLTAEELLQSLNGAKAGYEATVKTAEGGYRFAQTPLDAMDSMFNLMALSKNPASASLATIGREIVKWGSKGVESYLGPLYQVDAQQELLRKNDFAREFQKQEMEHLWDVAQRHPKTVGAVVDAFFGADFNATHDASAAEIFDQNPDFSDHETIQQLREGLGPQGEIYVRLNELEDLDKERHQEVMGVMSGVQTRLDAIEMEQKDFIEYFKKRDEDAEKRQEAEKQAAMVRYENQLILDGSRSGVYVLSTLAGFIDPKVGHVIDVVGNTAIKIVESINRYAEVLASGVGTLAQGMGAAVLTGNLLGAALGLFSLFGSSGPSPYEIIFDQLGKLSEQIDQLGKQMHERFDRVDQSLNVIYETLVSGIQGVQYNLQQLDEKLNQIGETTQQIQQQIALIRNQLTDIQGGLSRIQDQLSGFELDAAAYAKAGFSLELRERVFSDARWTYRMPNDPMPWERFQSSAEKYVAYAQQLAKETPFVSRVNSLDALMLESDFTGILTNLNFWLAFGRNTLGNTNIPAGEVSDPFIWATAAEAYLTLVLDWPEHAGRINVAGDLNGNAAAGDAINRGLPAAEYKFFETLLSQYRSSYEAYLTALAGRYSLFCSEAFKGRAYDLWSGIEQARPGSLPSMKPMELLKDLDSPPPGFVELVRPSCWMYHELGFGNFEMFYYLNSDVGFSDFVKEKKIFQIPYQVRIQVDVLLKGEYVVSRIHTSPWMVLIEYPSGTFSPPVEEIEKRRIDATTEYFRGNWAVGEQIREKIAKDGISWSREPFTEELERMMTALQQQLYTTVSRELLQPGTRLFDAGREMEKQCMVLRAYLYLCLPATYPNDDFLQSFFTGGEGLLRPANMSAHYSAAADNSRDVRIEEVLTTEYNKRYAALDEYLKEFLSEPRRENIPFIDSVLARITTVRSIQALLSDS